MDVCLQEHLSEQSRDGQSVEHLGGHDDGDLQSECEADQLVCVALDEIRVWGTVREEGNWIERESEGVELS